VGDSVPEILCRGAKFASLQLNKAQAVERIGIARVKA